MTDAQSAAQRLRQICDLEKASGCVFPSPLLVINDWKTLADAYLSAPQWQPIETAPKDGTPVLVFGVPDGEIQGEKLATIGIAKSTHGTYWEGCNTDAYSVFWTPTHWMPLPAQPAKESK